ncbi:MAG: hypothetical protein ACLGIJ_06190 [Candidatus Limnocylindria bacterium]
MALVGLLAILVVLVIAAVQASGSARLSIDDVPAGLDETTVEAVRADRLVTLRVTGSRDPEVRVTLCPGILPGPSDAAGIRERIRVSGCVDAGRAPDGTDATAWMVDLSAIDDDLATRFDAAERWLVVVTDPDRAGEASGGVAAAWIIGGPLATGGPVLP